MLAPSIAVTLAIVSPFCSVTDSLLGFINLTGTSSPGFTTACATITGIRSVVTSSNQESASTPRCSALAITSISLHAGILTGSVRTTLALWISEVVDEGCRCNFTALSPGLNMRVSFPMSMLQLYAFMKSIPRMPSVMSESATTTWVGNSAPSNTTVTFALPRT